MKEMCTACKRELYGYVVASEGELYCSNGCVPEGNDVGEVVDVDELKEKDDKTLLLEAIDNERLSDFICSNYTKFSKNNLMAIIRELDYAAYSECNEREYSEIMTNLRAELREVIK